MSGGLAVAESLGRLGEQAVDSAFYWTYPPDQSPAYWAFRAFRDYDGKRSTFLSNFVPTRASNGTSLFASRNDDRTKMTVVALNFLPETTVDARIDAGMCGRITSRKTYVFTGDKNGFSEPTVRPNEGETINERLPPYSITVMELQTSPAAKK